MINTQALHNGHYLVICGNLGMEGASFVDEVPVDELPSDGDFTASLAVGVLEEVSCD